MDDVMFDWAKIGELGIGVVALIVLYKVITLFVDMWSKSTDAINRNTEGFQQLSNTLARSHEREVEFQKEAIRMLKENSDLHAETHRNLIS